MKVRRRLVAVLAVVCGAVGLAVAAVPVADAASGPIFTVMNTSESLPDGVYFRNSPHTADTSRITGLGVYKNERVQLQCYATGDAVGAFNDKLWYYVNNVTRPTVGGRANVGYLNAHYINDGKNANQVDAGVPHCGAVSAPKPTSLFYSPIKGQPSPYNGQAVADTDVALEKWTGTNCTQVPAVNVVPTTASKLAGWSAGRLGPIYFLARAGASRVASVHTIILFDPGQTADFQGGCDGRQNINQLLANWLKSNSVNRLLVLTGGVSEERTWYGKSTFAGLWKYYFAGIWNQPFARQALVCDYNLLTHYDVLNDFRGVVGSTPSGCPVSSKAPKPVAWNP